MMLAISRVLFFRIMIVKYVQRCWATETLNELYKVFGGWTLIKHHMHLSIDVWDHYDEDH